MKIIINLSKNYSKKRRKIKYIILHYTGMQSAIESLKRLKNLKSKVSSHYFLDRNGNIIQLVKDQDVSWHAGRSKWKKDVNLNNNSIGIEIQNKGHKLGYQNYPKKQIKSLVFLLKKLKKNIK